MRRIKLKLAPFARIREDAWTTRLSIRVQKMVAVALQRTQVASLRHET